ncbi:MAG: transposase [Candidatus Aenigmarchaeota archaeon]|nr:transposase [Candidatus Aenigmarchaeota archaeon]
MSKNTNPTDSNGSLEINNATLKKVYSQNWSLYNLSQTKEKMMFLKLLNDAVDFLGIEYEYEFGRPHVPIDDLIKCCAIKVFNCFSSRRTIAELQLAYALGYIRQSYHFNTISKYMNDPTITPWLEKLYKLLALSLVDTESVFAVDATGFGLPHKIRWKEIRMKKLYREVHDFKKLHIISGVRTNIITSAKVTNGTRSDNPEFENLVRATSKQFRMKEILADAGYLSRKNCGISEEVGAVPYIFPKAGVRPRSHGYRAWTRMIRLWKENKQAFREHYHQRSNVESTFSALKRKFSGFVRSKKDTAQTNEILAKVVCHNVAVLISSIFCLGVEVDFD